MIEYYTLIAMACLYGGMLSMFITNYKLANMNSVGKRTSISPIRKGSMLLGTFLASYVVQLLGVAILFIFRHEIIKLFRGFFTYVFVKDRRKEVKKIFDYCIKIIISTIPVASITSDIAPIT